MRSVRTCQTLLLMGALAISPAFAGHTHRSPTSGHSHSKRKAAVHPIRGQRQIDPSRAREIQTALIHENYLTGEPSGEWDQQSQDAMQRYQADHNWQTKIIPDSRALIKLGLGPNASPASVTAESSAPAVAEPKAIEPDQPAKNSRTGNSSALTLADAHSILN